MKKQWTLFMKKIEIFKAFRTVAAAFLIFAALPSVAQDQKKHAERPNVKLVYMYVDEMPKFAGGSSALFEYLNENLKYPETASKIKIEGGVMMKFFVDVDGSLKDVSVVKYPENGEALGAEALRVVKAMPNWVPGKLNGKPVPVYYNLPIKFILQ